jgi:hypothetical protein
MATINMILVPAFARNDLLFTMSDNTHAIRPCGRIPCGFVFLADEQIR